MSHILPGSTPPISQRGTLRVMAVFGRASVSYCQAGKKKKNSSEELDCMAFEDSRLNYYLPASSVCTLQASVLGFSFKYKDALLSAFSVISLSVCFFPSEAGSLDQPATFESNLPLCLQEVNSSFPELLLLWSHLVSRCRITTEPIRNKRAKKVVQKW